MMLSRTNLMVLLALVTGTKGEMYFVNNIFHDARRASPYIQNERGHRFLQLQSNVNGTSCDEVDNRLICNVQAQITSTNTSSQANMNVTVQCDAMPGTPNFLEASNCECAVLVTDLESGKNKLCECVVCQVGDDIPIAVDCIEEVLIDECFAVGCDFNCNRTCSTDCEDSQADCIPCPEDDDEGEEEIPATESPMPLEDILFESVMDRNCTAVGDQWVCTQEARITAPDNSYSNVSMTVSCDIGAVGFLTDFRDAADPAQNCECKVDVIDQDGQERDCQCTVCPNGFGANPVAFICQGQSAVAECEYVDCNSQCGGTCVFNCDSAGNDCPLCVVEEAECYDLLTSESSHTRDTDAPAYHGIIFNIQAKENPVEILSVEVDAKANATGADLEVAIRSRGYESAQQWEYYAKAEVAISPDGSSLVISQSSLDPILVPANTTIGIYIRSTSGALLAVNTNGRGSDDTDFVYLPGIALTSDDPEDVANATSAYFAGKFHYRIPEPCKDPCPVCQAPPAPLDFNTTLDECTTTADKLICLRETRVTSPDNSTEFSDLEIEVRCDLISSTDYNFRGASNCTCSVDVTDHLGKPRNCGCSVCPDDFGSNPVAVQCQNDFLVGECSTFDCNAECNGSCSSSCDASGSECPLCSDSVTYSPAMETNSTGTPTAAPGSSTTAPTYEKVTYDFAGLTVRLKGGVQLNSASIAVFNQVTADFYRKTFQPAALLRRQLQEGLVFASFDNTVDAKGEDFDALGNTITYDQTITFSLSAGSLDKETARALMLRQLTHEDKKREYMEMLIPTHKDFALVTEVNPTSSRSSSDDDGRLDRKWLLIIVICGSVLLCCCCAACYAMSKDRGGSEKDADYDGENDMDRDAPEGPIYDHSEKSGEELFSNETDHRAVPFGEDDDKDSRPDPAPAVDDVHDNNSFHSEID